MKSYVGLDWIGLSIIYIQYTHQSGSNGKNKALAPNNNKQANLHDKSFYSVSVCLHFLSRYFLFYVSCASFSSFSISSQTSCQYLHHLRIQDHIFCAKLRKMGFQCLAIGCITLHGLTELLYDLQCNAWNCCM